MCRKYVIGSSLETISNRFNIDTSNLKEWNPPIIVSPGNEVPIITQENPSELTFSSFGMTPTFAKQSMQIINARTEGDKNPTNNPDFKGSKGIFLMPSFQKPLFYHRCLVIADAFIAWSDNASHQLYLVYLRNHERPFAMAGLYDIWINPKTLEKQLSFCIITVPDNSLLRMLPASRMPVMTIPVQSAPLIPEQSAPVIPEHSAPLFKLIF